MRRSERVVEPDVLVSITKEAAELREGVDFEPMLLCDLGGCHIMRGIRFFGHRALQLRIVLGHKIKLRVHIEIEVLLLMERQVFVVAIQKRVDVEIFGAKSLPVHVALLFAVRIFAVVTLLMASQIVRALFVKSVIGFECSSSVGEALLQFFNPFPARLLGVPRAHKDLLALAIMIIDLDAWVPKHLRLSESALETKGGAVV